jgi:hypothetical protein
MTPELVGMPGIHHRRCARNIRLAGCGAHREAGWGSSRRCTGSCVRRPGGGGAAIAAGAQCRTRRQTDWRRDEEMPAAIDRGFLCLPCVSTCAMPAVGAYFAWRDICRLQCMPTRLFASSSLTDSGRVRGWPADGYAVPLGAAPSTVPPFSHCWRDGNSHGDALRALMT